jgi:SPP1 family predicted phage head-tail adaptor
MDANRPHLITFQRSITTTDDYGGQVATWTTLCRAYASVSFGTGQERREAAQESASAPATFRVLYNGSTANLRPTDRIQYLGSAWDITSIAMLGLNEGVEVVAIRLQPTGDTHD